MDERPKKVIGKRDARNPLQRVYDLNEFLHKLGRKVNREPNVKPHSKNCWSASLSDGKTIDMQGEKVPFLDVDGLILLKKDSIREKDRLDVIHLKTLTARKQE